MRGIERKVAAAVFVSLLFGIACSIAQRDWQFFERSGSLVVVVGIVLAWRDLVSLAGDMERLYAGVMQSLKDQLNGSPPVGLLATAEHEEVRNRLEGLPDEMDRLSALFRKRIRTMEAIVLGLGTIIWGYGAPVAGFIWRFADA